MKTPTWWLCAREHSVRKEFPVQATIIARHHLFCDVTQGAHNPLWDQSMKCSLHQRGASDLHPTQLGRMQRSSISEPREPVACSLSRKGCAAPRLSPWKYPLEGTWQTRRASGNTDWQKVAKAQSPVVAGDMGRQGYRAPLCQMVRHPPHPYQRQHRCLRFLF